MKCPGQDTQFWKADAIYEVKCPKCGNDVEFFKDDTTRKCPSCGHRFLNPRLDFGCASYCPFAEQCIGNLPPELIAQREEMLKDRVAIEMKKYFKQDFKRIAHAMRVARFAEEIGRKEKGNLAIILTAAYLHDIGIKEAEQKYNITEPGYHEKEGIPVAKEILAKLGAKDELIEEVCNIIGHHHHPGADDTVDFRCLYDADMIVNLAEKQKKGNIDQEALKKVISESFLTETGRAIARRELLGEIK